MSSGIFASVDVAPEVTDTTGTYLDDMNAFFFFMAIIAIFAVLAVGICFLLRPLLSVIEDRRSERDGEEHSGHESRLPAWQSILLGLVLFSAGTVLCFLFLSLQT